MINRVGGGGARERAALAPLSRKRKTMRTGRMLRWTVLVAILAALAPAPASAQIGRFIKKRLKEKIAQTVIEAVVPGDTAAAAAGNPQAPAPGAEPAARGSKAAPGRAVKGGTPVAAPSGPAFNEYVLEMTPAVLDKLEQGLAAEAAERQANARVLARMRDTAAYEKCSREVSASPQGKKMMALLNSGDMSGYQQAAIEVGQLQESRCGPPPSHYMTVRDGIANKTAQAAQKASGFQPRQYDILKERALPFCSLSAPAPGGELKIPVRAGIFLVYSPSEVQALSGRCGRLLPVLKANL